MHPHAAHARTVNVLRLLRAIGPLPRRRGRMPRQQQPDGIRREYWKAILPTVRRNHTVFADIRPAVLRLLTDLRRRQGKQDIAENEAAMHLIRRATLRSGEAFSPRDVSAIAEKYGRRTSAFQKEQLNRQLVAAVGVPFSALEKPTRDLIPAFAKENTELIRTVGERYWERIAKETQEAFETGMEPATLSDRFSDIDGMSERDALRIARDQIGKLNADFNQTRQESIGITGYIWRGSLDNRERDEHRELEGKRFSWDEPPDAGTDGEPANPGEAIQCRCYAEPDLSGILGDTE